MNIEFRNATLQDVGEIMHLIKAAIINMEKHNIYQWDDVYPTKEDFENDIEKGHLQVGVINFKIAVVYAINQEFDEQYKNGQWKYGSNKFCVIHRLCVSPDFQNKGIARKTLEHIEIVQSELGTESIRLDAFSKNPYALNLYKHCGYEKVGYAEWRKGLFYLMEKQLS